MLIYINILMGQSGTLCTSFNPETTFLPSVNTVLTLDGTGYGVRIIIQQDCVGSLMSKPDIHVKLY